MARTDVPAAERVGAGRVSRSPQSIGMTWGEHSGEGKGQDNIKDSGLQTLMDVGCRPGLPVCAQVLLPLGRQRGLEGT